MEDGGWGETALVVGLARAVLGGGIAGDGLIGGGEGAGCVGVQGYDFLTHVTTLYTQDYHRT